VSLTFDLLVSGSMHADRLSCTVSVTTSVLIAQAVFFFRSRTDAPIGAYRNTDTRTSQTQLITPYPRIGYRRI